MEDPLAGGGPRGTPEDWADVIMLSCCHVIMLSCYHVIMLSCCHVTMLSCYQLIMKEREGVKKDAGEGTCTSISTRVKVLVLVVY